MTSVNGNIDVDSATRLSLELLDMLGRAVVRGAAAPLAGPERAPSAPEPVPETSSARVAAPGYAAAGIARRVVESPGEITVIAIGPLTNIGGPSCSTRVSRPR
ncbi:MULTISPECIES: nucleoside hydrolase [unclassified Streptomyces]|uniref:nucleoside hydrolase n=1 Tax=unclassified Streptomyces TaxID=2593676 RepID=UPI002E775845|nr:nucleoside hydrolase [Streptomyces sp. JV184]MEE1746314.1 nucleoside hydrolase [Streptomyces sp. JV184]